MKKRFYLILQLLVFGLIFASCGSDNTDGSSGGDTATASSSASIDVLVLYDRDVANAYADVATRVNHLFAVSNNVYRDSYLNITIHPKGILLYDAKTHPALDEIASSAEIQALRAQYKADTVLIYQVNPNGAFGQCGVAYGASAYHTPSQYRDAMFAQVEINCPTDTTAHELGHNMGLRHSHIQNGDNTQPFPYGLGHGVSGKFATIMAYPQNFNTTTQISRFSSPEYECIAGYPCGIPIGQSA
ncbi:MAG: zinc-dependent metalloprotease family protein [Sulfurovum sp.]|nr:zinc-dependent metalloprotease family protein [Sulfurovum sp.]